MIRPATLSDVNSIMALAQSEMWRYPQLKANPTNMRRILVNAVSSAKHFCWVSEDKNGVVAGTIVGLVGDNLWAQRQHCHVVLWVSNVVGDGVKLLRQAKKWVSERRVIRILGFAPDTNEINPRVWALIEKMGFARHGGAYLIYN